MAVVGPAAVGVEASFLWCCHCRLQPGLCAGRTSLFSEQQINALVYEKSQHKQNFFLFFYNNFCI